MDISNSLVTCSFHESWLSDYTLVEFINSGSYGGVYKAENKISKQLCAVKITHLQKHVVDGNYSSGTPETQPVETVRRKMLREYLLLADKTHPNIVHVYEGLETKLDTEDVKLLLSNVQNAANINAKHVLNNLKYWAGSTGLDALVIRMELCDVNLRQWIATNSEQDSNLSEIKAKIIKDIIDGLGFLHEHKILHRDLKSENIFFALGSNFQRVKIGDFGLGRIIHKDESKTSEQTVKPMTTPLYRAPQLELGNEYTLQADLYSLGLIMYEIINMLKTNYRSLKFNRLKHRTMTKDDLLLEPFENIFDIILQLTEKDPMNRVENVEELRIKLLGREIKLDNREYSVEEFCSIITQYTSIVGQPEGGTEVTGKVDLSCDNRVIRNIVFGSDLRIKGNKNKLSRITFANEKIFGVHLSVAGSGNIINDIKLDCLKWRVELKCDRNTVSNVVLENRETSICIYVWSGVGHIIKNIAVGDTIPDCNIWFFQSTGYGSVESVTCTKGYLDGKNHTFKNVHCGEVKVGGEGHQFTNCVGNVSVWESF